MLDITAILEKIKASPYEEIKITAPHTGFISFAKLKEGDKAYGPGGTWKEKPGSHLATINRENNPKKIFSPQKGVVQSMRHDLEGKFVEAGDVLLTLRHYLTKEEVQAIILKNALYTFKAPERAKFYFTPDVDKKVRASGSRAVTVHEGMELFIMSRMKRELPLHYSGPEGTIYTVYFKYAENVDAGSPLIGVCPVGSLEAIEEVVLKVQTEWTEKD